MFLGCHVLEGFPPILASFGGTIGAGWLVVGWARLSAFSEKVILSLLVILRG